MVGNSLAAGDNIVENEALCDSTDFLLQTVDMVELHGVAKVVDDLLEGFDLLCERQVIFNKCSDRKVCDLLHCISHDVQLVVGAAGEGSQLLEGLMGTDGNNEGLVRNKLQVGDGMQILGDDLILVDSHITAGELD